MSSLSSSTNLGSRKLKPFQCCGHTAAPQGPEDNMGKWGWQMNPQSAYCSLEASMTLCFGLQLVRALMATH